MRNYVLRRLALSLIAVMGAVVGVFLLTHVVAGNPAYFRAGPQATREEIERLERMMGLDKPLIAQFGDYIRGLMRGDMGTSWNTGHKVAEDLLQRFPASLELALLSLLIACGIGLPLGIAAAVKSGGWLDRFCQGVSVLSASTPLFWLGLVVVYVFYFRLHWIPAPMGRLGIFSEPPPTVTGLYTIDSLIAGDRSAFVSSISLLAPPAVVLAFVLFATIAKMARASMLSVLSSDYIRTANALGLGPVRVVVRHALPNTLVLVLTSIGIVFAYIIGGNVIVENIFAWPGLGQYAWNAIITNDIYALQGFVLAVAILYVLINLVVDILYSVVDPRIRLGQ